MYLQRVMGFLKFASFAGRCRLAASVAVCALASLTSIGAHAAPQLTVTAGNANGGSVYNLPLTASVTADGALIGGTQPLNTDGAAHGNFDALVWVPNSNTGTLDLIVADVKKGQLVRYSGPNYGTSTLIFTWTKQGSGPAHPIGLSADAQGNLFVISPSCAWDATPSLWVLPFDAATGLYGAPILIDHSFGGVRTLALAEVLVAGTDASADSSAAVAWHSGDVLVLVGDTFAARVIVYSKAAIAAVLANPNAPLSGPTSTAVAQSQFLRLLAVPFGMDIWPADATHGVSLLVTTIDGRILRFDSSQEAFVANFAGGAGLGLQKLKVGTYSNIPYAFVAQITLPARGRILQYGTPPASGANAPLATVIQGVSDPIGLAVSSSGSVTANTCLAPNVCNNLGGQIAQQFSSPLPISIPPDANILEESCIVQADPRAAIDANGSWSCLGPQINVCGSTPTPGCVAQTLDVANYCPGFPHTVLPAHMCGHSGPTGTGFAVVKSTAQAVDQNANNTFVQTTVDADIALPGPHNLPCPETAQLAPQIPIYAWAPRSDLPSIEGTIVEDLTLPNTFIDLSGYCDKGGGNSKVVSMYAYGLGLNSAESGLGGGPDGGLNGFVAAKFANLTQTITAAASQINPTVAATVQGYVNQSRDYFNASYQSDTPGGYACALNSLASADVYVRANLTAFHFAAPPAGNPNPAGDLDGRIANLFLSINSYFLLQPANTEWPTNNVPPCVTISVSPASIIAGSSGSLTWGAATPAYALSFPPAQCTLSAGDGTFTTPAAVGPSGAGVSTGTLTQVGGYTASLECTGAQADKIPGLATATATVIAPPVLTSIAVTPPAASIGDLFTQQFAATGTFSFGPTQDLTNSVIWSSSNLGVATISANGLASCHAAGSVTIVAASGAKNGYAALTCQKVLSSLSLSANGASTKLAVGGTVQIAAQGTYTDGSSANVSGAATWSSSNPAVATVSGGLVTAIAAGYANISASINDPIAGTVTAAALTVTVAQPVTLQKLVLSPSYSVSIAKGSSKQFTLQGCFSDGSTRTLTSSATWTSSNTAVATVSAGLVTGVYKGSAKIYASYGGLTASPVGVTVTSSDR
jgi:hypothetical protein